MRFSKEFKNNLNHFPTTVFICSWKIMIARGRISFAEIRKAFLYLHYQQDQKEMGMKIESYCVSTVLLNSEYPISAFYFQRVKRQICFSLFSFLAGQWLVDFEVKSKDPVTFWINLNQQCFHFLSLLGAVCQDDFWYMTSLM